MECATGRFALGHLRPVADALTKVIERFGRLSQRAEREVHPRAVVREQALVPEGERIDLEFDQLVDRHRVARGLRHLHTVGEQVLPVHPVADRRVAVRALRLCDLVLVVREDVVDAAGVEVEALAEVLRAHRRTLDVPAGKPTTPGRLPGERAAFLCLLPEREVDRIALVGIELIVDVLLQLLAVLGEPGLELDVVGEELQPLAPGRLGLLRLLGLPVAVAEGDPGADVNLSLLGLGFRHRHRLLEVRHPQRRAAEDLGPVEIAVPPRVEGDPALLELDRLREVGERVVGQDHLGDRAGIRDLVDIGVAVVEPGEGGLRMGGGELAVEVDGAVVFLGADDGLAVLVRVRKAVGIGVERGLEQRQRRGVVVSGDGLHGVVERGGVEGRRGADGEQQQRAKTFHFFLGSAVKGFGAGSPSTSR